MNKKNLQDSDLRNAICIAPNHIMYPFIKCKFAETTGIPYSCKLLVKSPDYSWRIKVWNFKVTTIKDLRDGWREWMGPPPVYPESHKK